MHNGPGRRQEEAFDEEDDPMTGTKSRFGLDRQGMHHLGTVHWNQSAPVLYEHAVRRGEGELASGGSFSVTTGALYRPHPARQIHRRGAGHQGHGVSGARSTSRSPPSAFDSLHQRMLAYLQGRELFVQDLYAGADPAYRLPVRVVTDSAWHSLFSRNMFIRPPADELPEFEPAFTILHAPKFLAIPELDRINSETFIFVNFAERLVLIGGTAYAGEIKKSVFRLSQFRVAGARRIADARFGQCRPEGRLRDLLRTFRHRQDDACRPTIRAP